jgi:hypothetical protein
MNLGRGADLGKGAKLCMGLITLSEFESEFARWAITTEVSEFPA